MHLETKWQQSCLPVADRTESVELKITSAHAFENNMAAILSSCSRWDSERGTYNNSFSASSLKTKWRLSCLPVADGT
jgi:hypothetical protein